MAAISISVSHGASGNKMSDFTIGTSAPGTGDFEFRWNTTNTNSKNILHHEAIIALKWMIRAIEQGGNQVDLISSWSGTTPPPPSV